MRGRSSGPARPGFALMLALWLIVVLGAVAAGVAVGARDDVAAAETARARTTARYAAESGITWAQSAIASRLAPGSDAVRAPVDLGALLPSAEPVALGEARFQVTLVDVNARVDVNAADAAALARLFAHFGSPLEAEGTARAIRRAVTGGEEGGAVRRVATPLESLDALERIPGVSVPLVRAAAEYLTVDGDGRINRASASDTVLAAAAGDLVDGPTRVLVVSRGWRDGHAYTHEVQAVYALEATGPALVRWRERTR